MNTFNFIKKYALAMIAVATVVTFSAFKVSGTNAAFMTVPVYFHGNEAIQSQVADESRWTIVPNGGNCNDVDELACMILVDHTDLTGAQLDSTKVTLSAIKPPLSTGYIPEHTGGSGTPDPIIVNRS